MQRTFRVFRWYTGGSVYGRERWAVREDGRRDPADILSTRSGADYAAHALNIGACHIDRHRPLGARVQPGAPREVIEQRARELGDVIASHQTPPRTISALTGLPSTREWRTGLRRRETRP